MRFERYVHDITNFEGTTPLRGIACDDMRKFGGTAASVLDIVTLYNYTKTLLMAANIHASGTPAQGD